MDKNVLNDAVAVRDEDERIQWYSPPAGYGWARLAGTRGNRVHLFAWENTTDLGHWQTLCGQGISLEEAVTDEVLAEGFPNVCGECRKAYR